MVHGNIQSQTAYLPTRIILVFTFVLFLYSYANLCRDKQVFIPSA